MIAVVDYGMGNLRSVHKALEQVGVAARVTSSPQEVEDAQGVVLPGVGAFRDCMRNLERLQLIQPLRHALSAGKPFLGICLGLQVLFSESEEFELTPGLGHFSGRVVRFPASMPDPDANISNAYLKVPHMGWNTVAPKKAAPCLEDIDDVGATGRSPLPGKDKWFYFVHSYYVAPTDPRIIATSTRYGIEFCSSVARDQLFACQFHPEKSQARGLQILRNFGRLAEENA
jgi:imidazole glycerol-phosphate synthase subunit HisH